jgi:hypothetical protein
MLTRIVSFVLGFTLMWGILGSQKALSMGSTQFGTYSQEYLDRQKCKADAKAAGKPEEACRKRRDRRGGE